jgi:hypothetical protein
MVRKINLSPGPGPAREGEKQRQRLPLEFGLLEDGLEKGMSFLYS